MMNDYNSPDTDPMLYHEASEYEDDVPKLEQNRDDDDDYIDEM